MTSAHGRVTTDAAALVIGFTIQGLAVARALSKHGIKVYAIERRSDSPAFKTRHASILYFDNLLDRQLVDALLQCRARIPEKTVVLFPASDNTTATLAKFWDELKHLYTLSWAESRHEIVNIIHKAELPAYCEATGTLYPKTSLINSDEDIQACAAKLAFPVLVKPNKPASSFKTYLVRDATHLSTFVHKERANWPLVAQEWIDGPDSSLYFYSCILDRGKELFGMTGRKVRASPPGLGRATVIQSVEDAGVRTAARELMRAFDISGPASLEFKKDASGRYWFIEANVGRTEYCIDLPIQAGFNVPVMEFALAIGQAPRIPSGEPTHAIWFDTEKEPFCYIALCARLRTLRPFGKKLVFPYFGHGEPRLAALAGIAMLENVMSRGFQRIRSVFGAEPRPADRSGIEPVQRT